jgi:hypothetical protein
MPMKSWCSTILLLSLGLAGCLEPSRGALAYKDLGSPFIISTTPAANGTITRAASIVITFSEAMDTRTLGAGIQVSKAGIPVPIVLGIPPVDELPQTADNVDQPYTVSAKPVTGFFEQSIGSAFDYTMALTTLLTDQAGNPLPAEVRIRFSVM